MLVKECSQKYYDRLLSKNKVDSDTLYVIKPKYKELEAENKRLQEQLNEANEVIKGYAECYKKYPDGTMFSFEVRKHPAHSYLEKWSVKNGL